MLETRTNFKIFYWEFQIAIISFCVVSVWAQKTSEAGEPKDKREAPTGYQTGHASHTLQIEPSVGHGDGNTISIGAGYSVGGAKPNYAFESHGGSPSFQLASHGGYGGHHGGPSEGQTIRLPPITLQPQDGNLLSGDLTQLMNQIQHSLSTGAIQLQPSTAYHGGGGGGGQQQLRYPQFSFVSPKPQQYNFAEAHSNIPSYAAGTKGLGSFGSTGPVLFNPNENHPSQTVNLQSTPNAGHSFGETSLSGLSLGQGHQLGAYSLDGHPQGHTPTAQQLGGISFGSLGHSFGGNFKQFAHNYPQSKPSFKPSTLLGVSGGDSHHGSSGLAPKYHGTPVFSHSLPAGHGHAPFNAAPHAGYSLGQHNAGGAGFGTSFPGFNLGSAKYVTQAYAPAKSEGFGSSLESLNAFTNNGHLASHGGVSSSPHGASTAAAHASSASPQYFLAPAKHSHTSSFGDGSVSYKAPSSLSGHSHLSSLSSPKYFSSHQSGTPSLRYLPQKDSHGAYSDSTYNTIKYSEEFKPRAV